MDGIVRDTGSTWKLSCMMSIVKASSWMIWLPKRIVHMYICWRQLIQLLSSLYGKTSCMIDKYVHELVGNRRSYNCTSTWVEQCNSFKLCFGFDSTPEPFFPILFCIYKWLFFLPRNILTTWTRQPSLLYHPCRYSVPPPPLVLFL